MNASDIAALYIEAMLHVRQLKRERGKIEHCTAEMDDSEDEWWRGCYKDSSDPATYCDSCKLRHAKSEEIWSAAAKQAALLKLYKKAIKQEGTA